MPNTTDTSPEAYAVQLELLRKMTPRERLRRTLAWSQELRRMAMAAIRRQYPEYDEACVRLKFIELTYGKELADDVRRWQKEINRE